MTAIARNTKPPAAALLFINAVQIDTPISADIRHALWAKLLSNIAVSQVCVLTRSNLGEANGDEGCFALSRRLMIETAAVSGALGVDLDGAVKARIEGGPVSSRHKPSTLQDLELGRPMEIDAMVGAVAELGRMTGTPTPYIDMIYALLRRLALTTGTYPANPDFTLDYD